MKVLLIRLSSLGDVILATSAVGALGEDLPEAEVHVLTKAAFRDVFDGLPGVARIVPWEPSEGLGTLAREVRRERYDWVVDLHGNLRTRALRLLVPGGRWSRYRKGSLGRRAAVALRKPSLLPARHVVDRYLRALAPLGVGPSRRLPRLVPGEARLGRAVEGLRAAGWQGEPVVALAPGARWPTKAWPPGRWVELLRGLARQGLGFPALVGGAAEAGLCRDLLAAAGTAGANLAGRGGILDTAAALQAAFAVVTNDSAPLHAAAAVGTPAVALFGPTVQGFGFYPLGPRDVVLERDLPCRPCSLHGTATCRLGHGRCLADIGAEEVLEALGAMGAEPHRRGWGEAGA